MDKKILHRATRHLRKHKKLSPYMGSGAAILKEFAGRRPGDPFQSLLRSIMYQQLSGKAVATILSRLLANFSGRYPTPRQMLALPASRFRKAGVSARKTRYLKDLAKRFIDGTITPKHFPTMTDEEIREHLLVVKGIGRWTADMFLMFTLYRPDVLPTGDLGIQKGFQKLFSLRKMPSAAHMERLAREWAPYRTVASWYLWRVVDDGGEAW